MSFAIDVNLLVTITLTNPVFRKNNIITNFKIFLDHFANLGSDQDFETACNAFMQSAKVNYEMIKQKRIKECAISMICMEVFS